MNKAEFKEKRKKLLEQRVRPTEGTEAVSAWDYDFNDSNEVLQSGEVELLENMTSIVPEDRPKTGEIFKEKRNKTRHKLDAPILSEQLSDYTTVTIEGVSHEMWLPVLDGANKAIENQLHSCDSGEFSFCFARIIFCSLKALVPLCIRMHMEICRIDDRSGCGKG